MAYGCEISDECWISMLEMPEGTNFYRAQSGTGYWAVDPEGVKAFIPFQPYIIGVYSDETNEGDSLERPNKADYEDLRQKLLMADPDETEGVGQ